MKILIVRHGDPNYEIDGLTEKGQREAELLSQRLAKEKDPLFYCSVLGRARLTLAPTLEKLGKTAEYFEWLREFSYVPFELPDGSIARLPWDRWPSLMKEYHLNGY